MATLETKSQLNTPQNGIWYKLDLSAIVYPTLQRRDFSSVYRLSVLLKEEINPQVLQQALDMTLPRFPTYKAAIRKGLFWRYLEPNNRPGPFVQEDVQNPCQPMYFKANNRYLIRVYYYKNRIALEAHHSLGDGTGGMCLLMTVAAVLMLVSAVLYFVTTFFGKGIKKTSKIKEKALDAVTDFSDGEFRLALAKYLKETERAQKEMVDILKKQTPKGVCFLSEMGIINAAPALRSSGADSQSCRRRRFPPGAYGKRGSRDEAHSLPWHNPSPAGQRFPDFRG